VTEQRPEPTQQDLDAATRWYADEWPLLYGAQFHDAERRIQKLAALLAETRAAQHERTKAVIRDRCDECRDVIDEVTLADVNGGEK